MNYIRKLEKLTEKELGKISEDKETRLYIFHKKNGTIPVPLFGLLKDIPVVEFKQADNRDDILIAVGMIIGELGRDEVFDTDSDIKLPDCVRTAPAKKSRTRNAKPDEKKNAEASKADSPNEKCLSKEKDIPSGSVESNLNPPEEPAADFENTEETDTGKNDEKKSTDSNLKKNKSKTENPSVKTETSIHLINHYVDVRYNEAGFEDEVTYARAIGDAMIAAGKDEERLLSELQKRFAENVADRLFVSISMNPLVWSQLNPEAVSQAENDD